MNNHLSPAKVSISFWMLLSPMVALAQVPNAGQAIRDIESLQPLLPAPEQLDLDLSRPGNTPTVPASPGGMHIAVRDFVLEGNQVIDSDTLLAQLNDLRGQHLDLAGLQDAAQRITAFYQHQGYALARAFLPAQEIDQGVVRIAVLEGRYGEIQLNNRSRTRDRVMRARLSQLRQGEAVQDAKLNRALLLLRELPGIASKGTLRPGATPGSTDLVIDVDPGSWANASLEADNYGGQYTGQYRLGGSLSLNNPLRAGDVFSLRMLQSDQQQRYYRAGYMLPLGPWSTTLGASYSEMTYALGKDFSVLEAHGRARITSVFASQPLVRSLEMSINAQLQYDDKQLRDEIDLFELSSPKRVELWTLGMNGAIQDHWLGGGQNQFSLGYSTGRLSFGNPDERALDRLSANTVGRFSRANLHVARLQRLSSRWQLYTQFGAQWASTNLDSSEKFSLGGPDGVRAFALGAGAGDQGWQASAELRYQVRPNLELNSVFDKGQVWLNRHPWSAQSSTHSQAATGVGATWSGASQKVSLTAAWPVKQREQDEAPHQDPRIWVSAIQYF